MDDLTLLWINFTRSQTRPEVLREIGANFTVNWSKKQEPARDIVRAPEHERYRS